MKKFKEYLLPIYIILNLLYILIGSYFWLHFKLSYFNFAKSYWLILILNIFIILLIIIKKIINKENFFKLTDIFLLLILIFSFISYLCAINKDVALHGLQNRYEGLYSILYYFSLFVLSSFVKKEHKKYIIYTIIFIGIIQALYSICQVANIFSVVRITHYDIPWATGFSNNPNFFGTFMLICLCYAIELFIKKNKKIIPSLLIILFMTSLLLSNALSCVVGLTFVCIFILIYGIKHKLFKSLLILASLLLVTTLTVHFSGQTTIINDVLKTGNETADIINGKSMDHYGSKRIFIWRKTLEIVPQNLIHGVGIDNFYYAFDGKALTSKRQVYDKAHNEYLQILITEGIFSLISYLIFYFLIIKSGLKSYHNKKICSLLPVIGYLVQAFFNISVIEFAPFFYISIGLLVDRN